MKNQILYVEDGELIRLGANCCLTKAFSDYTIILAEDGSEVKRQIDSGTVSLEQLAIICTDGHLGGNMTGWDVVELLRTKGYSGPAIYTGSTQLPKDKRHLYSETCNSKTGDKLIEIIRKYL